MSCSSQPESSPSTGRTFERRLAEVEDRLAIRELVARYCFAIDDRDLRTVGDLFTENASFGSDDGVMRAVGRAAIVKQFEGRYSVLGATNHISHDHVIRFEGESRARGQVSSHAEVWRHERAMIAAMRYADVYEKSGGVWRFAERVLSFMYYLPIEDYSAALGRLDRNRASDKPLQADYPERLPTWVEYRPDKKTS